MCWSDVTYPLFSRQIFKKILKYQISWRSFRWEPSCFMRTDERTDRHDGTNSSFS